MSETVRISDFSDRELLAVIADLARANGKPGGAVTAREVACRVFGIKDTPRNADDLAYYTKCVTARFTWMKRYGLLDKGEYVGEWFLSTTGNALRNGRLTPGVASAIATAKDDRSLDLAYAVGEKLVRAGSVAATAMRRELAFQIDRRKRMVGAL